MISSSSESDGDNSLFIEQLAREQEEKLKKKNDHSTWIVAVDAVVSVSVLCSLLMEWVKLLLST